MIEPTTWAAVGLAAVGVAQTVGMGWLRLHFKKNRNLGRERDRVVEESTARTEAALKEFGVQLGVVVKDGWANSSRISVLETKADTQSRQLERLERLLEDLRR